MKETRRIVVLSALVALVFGGAAIGTTYAIFTGKADNNVTITAGKIAVSSTGEFINAYSMETALTPADNKVTFENGGTATYADGVLALDKMTPGDKVTIKVTPKNESNIKIKYRMVIEVGGEIKDGIVVTAGTETVTGVKRTDWAIAEPGASIGDAQTIAVEMPEGTGNEYQDKTGTVKIIFKAVQSNADVSSYVKDDTAKTLLIKDEEGMEYWDTNADSLENYNITLAQDMDMSYYSWVAVGKNMGSYPGGNYTGVFDGAGHTITGLNVTGVDASGNALYGTYTCTGLFAATAGEIKNLTLDKATVVGAHWVGGIVGYSSSSTTKITNCHVLNSTITCLPEVIGSEYDNGDKAGSIIGTADGTTIVENCSAENVTIHAYRDIGGIAGAAHGTVTGNSVKNITLIQDSTHPYHGTVDTVGAIVGRDLGGTVMTGNTDEGVTIQHIA